MANKDKVVGLVSKTDKEKENHKKDLKEVLDSFKEMVDDGSITEDVISSLNKEGEVVIHTCSRDLMGAIALYELGKLIVLQQQ